MLNSTLIFSSKVNLEARFKRYRALRSLYQDKSKFKKELLIGNLLIGAGKIFGLCSFSGLPCFKRGMIGLTIIALLCSPVFNIGGAVVEVQAREAIDMAILDETFLTSQIEDGFVNKQDAEGEFEYLTYIIEEGDNWNSIAEMFGIKVATLQALNGKDLPVGEEIKYPPYEGAVYEVKKGDSLIAIAEKYGVSQYMIRMANKEISEDGTVIIGQQLFIPGGELQVRRDSYVSNGRNVDPSARYVAPGPSAGDVSGEWYKPASCKRVTQRFSGRHTGIDCANDKSTPIYAAQNGEVLKIGIGWSGGYGNHIVIRGENGYDSLYAHLSGVSVEKGQKVKAGDQIGLMGTTGRSTGNHLHFEVIQDGRKIDPGKFVGF